MKPTITLITALLLVPQGAAIAEDATSTLWYDRPAQKWVEALPVGNGRLGAMVFGGVEQEHLQFNEDSLWLGDEVVMGSYQPFGDLFVEFVTATAENYRRELNLRDAVHTVTYTADGATYRREVFSSFPDQVLVMRLTASRPGRITGSVRLTDAHKADVTVTGNRLTVAGSLTNGVKYAAEALVLTEGGEVSDGRVANADAVTILLAAGTSLSGKDPHRQLTTIAGKPYAELRAAHVADHRRCLSACSWTWAAAGTHPPSNASRLTRMAPAIRRWRRCCFSMAAIC